MGEGQPQEGVPELSPNRRELPAGQAGTAWAKTKTYGREFVPLGFKKTKTFWLNQHII